MVIHEDERRDETRSLLKYAALKPQDWAIYKDEALKPQDRAKDEDSSSDSTETIEGAPEIKKLGPSTGRKRRESPQRSLQ